MEKTKKGFLVSVFDAMIRYIYSGNEQTVAGIRDLDQLFRLYILADKVRLYLGTVHICVSVFDPNFFFVFYMSGSWEPLDILKVQYTVDPGLVFDHTFGYRYLNQ
jgi:hypothetical protein